MKKINSYNLSIQKTLYNNFWRRNNCNPKKPRIKYKNKLNSLSLFKENDFQKRNNNNKLLEKNFSENNVIFNGNKVARLKMLDIKENFKMFSSVTNYLLNKNKKIKELSKYKELRQDNLKKLLQESKSDQNILGKTFSTKFINDDELKSLKLAYENGHIKKLGGKPFININNEDDEYNQSFIKTQTQLLHKYNISPTVKPKERKYLNSIKPKKGKSYVGISSPCNYYKDQFDSFKTLKINKNLFNILLLKQEKELIKNIIEKGLIDEQNKLKLQLMPKIHVVELSKFKKEKTNSNNKSNKSGAKESTKENLQSLENCINLNKISRKELFEEHNLVYIKTISKFISTPTCRQGAQMLLYYDDKKGINKIILFGGENVKCLNDVWECSLLSSNKIDKKYIWKKIELGEEVPSPRNGHTMKFFQGNLYIYGGIVDDLPNKPKEDILIYNLIGQRFSIDYTLNKNEVGWRSYHIAEIIGPHMFIYGGSNERGNIIAEPFALDLYEMKWIPAPFTTDNLPKRKYHSSCQVFPQNKRYSSKFFLFKVFNDAGSIYNTSKILAEGIYIFGGINEHYICNNDLLIIKRGKPLQLYKGISKGIPPSPRCQCSMNFFEKLNVIIIYGGKNDKIKEGPSYFNDMFFLDVQTLSWINIEFNDDIFPPRASHCSCLFDNELIIFGGKNENFFLKSDLLICNLDIIENSKFKRFSQIKSKKRKDKENKNDHSEDKTSLNPTFNKIEKSLEKFFGNNEETSNNSTLLTNVKKNKLPYNFFQNFPQLRKTLEDKFKEIDGIYINSTDSQNIKDIIKGSSFSP